MAVLLIVYCVPKPEVTSLLVPSAYRAVTVNRALAPIDVNVLTGVVTDTDRGIAVVLPKTMCGRFTTPLAGIRKGSDSPEIVLPSTTQVTRARTRPKFAGTLGNTHEPLGRTRTFRLSTLTVQFSFNCLSFTCAAALRATDSESTVSASVPSAK